MDEFCLEIEFEKLAEISRCPVRNSKCAHISS